MRVLISNLYLLKRNIFGLGLVALIALASGAAVHTARVSYHEAAHAQQHVDRMMVQMVLATSWAGQLANADAEERERLAYRGGVILREARRHLWQLCNVYRDLTPGTTRIFDAPIDGEKILIRFFGKLSEITKDPLGSKTDARAQDLILFAETNAVGISEAVSKELHRHMDAQNLRLATVSLAAPVLTIGALLSVGLFVFAPMRRAVIQSQTALARALDQAEKANAAKDHFLNTICHQLRTPMNGIIGTTELLRISKLEDRQRTLTDALREAGLRMNRVLDQIFTYCDLRLGGVTLERSAFDPAALIEAAAEAAGMRHAERGCRFDHRWEGPPPADVRADPGLIHRVLAEILDNASLHGGAGVVTIEGRIAYADTARSPGRLVISVSDDGPGIPAEMRERIFESFEKGIAVRTDDYGVGLGLTISRELVGLMDGRIAISGAGMDADAPGTCVRIEVPLQARTTIELAGDRPVQRAA